MNASFLMVVLLGFSVVFSTPSLGYDDEKIPDIFPFESEGNYFLGGATCERLVKELVEIASLKITKENPTPKIDASLCSKDSVEGKIFYKVLLKPYLTPWLADVLGKKTQVKGPNCISAALAAAGVVPFSGGAFETETFAIFHSPVCRELNDAEEEMPGDILAIYHGKTLIPSHVLVHLSKSLVFQKLDDHPGRFQMDLRKEAFLPLRSRQPAEQSRFSVFRCRPIKDVVEKADVPANQVMHNQLAEIFKLGEDVAKATWNPEKTMAHFDLLKRIDSEGEISNAMIGGMGGLLLTENDLARHALVPPWYWRWASARLNSYTKQILKIQTNE